jgi:hypothetical protein
MKQKSEAKPASEGEQGEQGEGRQQRSYAAYSKVEHAFDPMKDLNLPDSYEEVVSRFKRLQGDRAMETLN